MKQSLRVAAVALLLSVASAQAFSLSGTAVDGKVVDENTGSPVAGAVVVVTWVGDTSGIVGGNTVCYHVETTMSDADGKFHTPRWFRWSLSGILIAERGPRAKAYKTGYTGPSSSGANPSVVLIAPGTDDQYFENLLYLPNCPEAAESRKNLYRLYAIVAKDSEPLARSREQKERVARIQEQAKNALVDHSKPTVVVGGSEVNVNPQDNYKAEELLKQ